MEINHRSIELSAFTIRLRWQLIVAFLVLGLLGYAGSWLMRPAYRAEALVMPAQSQTTGLLSSLSALAGTSGLLGFGLANDADKNEAMATIRSRVVLATFVVQEGLVAKFCSEKVIICAKKSIDAALSDERDLDESIRLIRDDLLSVGEDAATGIIHVSITWFNREEAAKWCNALIALTNSTMVARARGLAIDRVAHLTEELSKASLVSMQAAIGTLLQAELSKELDAGTRVEFALRFVDPASIPDDRYPVRPRRALIAVLAGSLGAAMWLAYCAFRARRVAAPVA